MRIVFMGTPEFAVPSLKALVDAGYEVAAVVTQPDRPKGRGMHVSYSPVKECALTYSIPVLQPARINDEAFINALKNFNPDCIVVIAYGKILPKDVLVIPPKGCINVHASLLPKYRGAAPINWAIINGEKETGATTMLMDEGMDTGDILLAEKMEIEDDDTAQYVHDKLKGIGARLLIKTLKGLEAGEIKPISQDDRRATYAPMLKKEDGRIDWTLTPEEIRNLIRGLYPWPGAYTRWEGKQLKIFRAEAVRWELGPPEADRSSELRAKEPGTVIDVSSEGIRVTTGGSPLLITELQPENKNRMSVAEFIKGYKIVKSQIFD